MPFNGSGTYTAPSSPGAFNPASSGGSATPSAWNTLLADIETALSTCVTKDGQTTLSAAGRLSLSNQLGQLVSTQTGAVATGTTQMPSDDTIPQNTEGNEYMTLAITPQSATSTLVIEVCFVGAINQNNANLTVALFQDSTANAVAAVSESTPTAGFMMPVCLRHVMTSGTTSATTFKVRAGADVAGITTFNGSASTRRFGGVCASSIVIREVLA